MKMIEEEEGEERKRREKIEKRMNGCCWRGMMIMLTVDNINKKLCFR